ncbi:glucosaminidase domain-containing protein, partial [Enterococcus pallens]
CFGVMGCRSQIKEAVGAETIDSGIVQEETTQSEKDSTVQSRQSNSQTREASGWSVPEETTNKEGSAEISEGFASSSIESSEAVIPESTALAEIIQPPSTNKKAEENDSFAVLKNQTTEEFIQLIGSDAQQIAWDNGLYASVMIAQAILETGSGNSQLARPPHHNLFGIKGSYQGKQVSFKTKEDKGNGELYTIRSAFRQYPSYRESLEDYASLLKKGLSGNPQFYQGTWKEVATTYREATKALTGRYATDTSYDKKLNALIEAYELTRFDQEPNREVKPIELTEVSQELPKSEEPTTEMTDSNHSIEENQVVVTETKQSVVKVSPITQRPAKQVAGKQIVE